MTATTRDGVLRKMREARAALAASGDLVTGAPTVERWVATYIERGARDRLAPGTARTYRTRLRCGIAPTIGRVRVDRLTPAHVVQMHDDLVALGNSPATVRSTHTTLSAAMREAYRLGLTPSDVMGRVRPPEAGDGGDSGALTLEEARTLLASLEGDPAAYARWTVSLFTGMRQGEVLGLTWEALDLAAGTLTLAWQLQRLNAEHGCQDGACGARWASRCPEARIIIPRNREARIIAGTLALTRPKNPKTVRVIPLAAPLVAALAAHRDATAVDNPHGLVFARPDGSPIPAADDTVAWRRALVRAGLPSGRLHMARSTCATLLAELRVDEQVRMHIMGHSSSAMARLYAKVTPPRTAEALEALADALAGDAPAPAGDAVLARLVLGLDASQRAALRRMLGGEDGATVAS